jgi:hypothetical protein
MSPESGERFVAGDIMKLKDIRFYLMSPLKRRVIPSIPDPAEFKKENERYLRMLKKCAKNSACQSFYCLPANESTIPSTDGECYGDICYCPKCHKQMEKRNIVRGCGRIDAFYCRKHNFHWVLDVYGIVPPRKWYGPFVGHPGWMVNYFWSKEFYARKD